jgi:hypothetical protein
VFLDVFVAEYVHDVKDVFGSVIFDRCFPMAECLDAMPEN